MEDVSIRLAALKAQYYALLATFGGLLLLMTLVFTWQFNAASPEQPEMAVDMPLNGPESPQIAAGKELFIANCAACHHKNMRDDLTGPALAGAEARWVAYPRKDLYDWIRNSQQMIHSRRHPRAVELWKKWGPTQMNSFPDLKDEQIEELLAYISK